ncbi:filamentous hemagglutinin family protein [Chelatococcus caeni]|uniref:Filamentous hemagglutinin family protein n=1 Tax=Chelatococcus caeni TaxID=1348468 RepID=A0A840BVE3_9HYPH|nr:filamentous hemagglutinin N-terminal domain-containing protein [Chelatococcus caeni]MBB4017441.1 filamentous hemagglutinin family protein [Chelatococcus caeni]
MIPSRRSGRPLALAAGFAALALGANGAALAQAVQADGGTATMVTVGAGGRITVGIAPPGAHDISRNTYTHFSVPAAGVVLDNSAGAGARTILNEVTSANRSRIEGPLEVLGNRAHVILANPNGITVNGGSFINTSGVLLSTGQVRIDGGAITATSGAGDIEVGPGGLGGTMASLQMLAARIRIDGPVTNTNTMSEADVGLTAGDAELTLDAAVRAGDSIPGWITSRSIKAGASEDVLVDVTQRGSLSASRVSIAVNAKGAGVSYAGAGQAARGTFTIDANGKVTLAGAAIEADRAVKIAADAVEVLNAPARQSTLASSKSAVTLLARAGDLVLKGRVTGAAMDADDPDSRGDVTLFASGDIRLLSDSPDRLAIAFAAGDGGLSVTAGGTVENRTGRLVAAERVNITAARLENVTDMTPAGTPQVAVVQRAHGSFFGRLFGKRRRFTVASMDYGLPRIPLQLGYIAGETVLIFAADVVNSGQIDAYGALVMETERLHNIGLASGSWSYSETCGFTCTRRGASTAAIVGGNINAEAGMLITAGESVVNDGGRIWAIGELVITAPEVRGTARSVPVFATMPGGLGNAFAGPTTVVSFQQVGGVFETTFGTLRIVSDGPVILDAGAILAGAASDIANGILAVSSPDTRPAAPRRKIGLVADWF